MQPQSPRQASVRAIRAHVCVQNGRSFDVSFLSLSEMTVGDLRDWLSS